jgi:glycosyltransferase involved in cell wall biosynthesis
MEREVISTADKVVCVNEVMAKEFEQMGAYETEVVTNGFDDDDFHTEQVVADKKFSIVHLGAINKDRNSENFWEMLDDLKKSHNGFSDDLEIVLIGKVDFTAKESIKKAGLEENTKFIAHLPHDEAIEKAAGAQVLLLPLNNTPNAMGITTGKLFEYLALKRPIFCIGPEKGACADIISKTMSGNTVDFDNKERMAEVMREFYKKYKNNELYVPAKGIQKYSRKTLTAKIGRILDSIVYRAT